MISYQLSMNNKFKIINRGCRRRQGYDGPGKLFRLQAVRWIQKWSNSIVGNIFVFI